MILKNQDVLLGKKNIAEKNATRESFLKENKKKSLKELVDAYSVESLKDQTEAKKPKIIKLNY